MKKVVILGSGISALSAAWYLKEKRRGNVAISLYEKKNQVGGSIQTVEKEGFYFERGPRGFRTQENGKRVLALVEALGIKDQLIKTSEKGKKRYLFEKDRLQRLSCGYLAKERLLWPLVKEPFVKKNNSMDDETIFNFFSRRFGKKVTTKLIDPMVRGIFAGDIRKLSMAAVFPKFFGYEKRFGSLVKGLLLSKRESFSLYSFKKGMATLPQTLFQKLKNDVSFHFDTFPSKLEKKNGRILLHFDSIDSVEADCVIAAIPAYEIASLLPSRFSFLDQIPYLSISTLNLGFDGDLLPLDGFGFLVPSSESKHFLGMTFDSYIFPQLNSGSKTRLCLIFSGVMQEKEALKFAKTLLAKLFSITSDIKAYDFHVSEKSLPQYSLDHLKRLKEFSFAPLYLAGNYLEGISLIDCVANAEKLIDALF